MFSLNVFTHLKSNLLALSKETESLGSTILPYFLIGGVSISNRGYLKQNMGTVFLLLLLTEMTLLLFLS